MMRHSLFFGIDKYSAESGMQKLKCAVRDAKELSSLFSDETFSGKATKPLVKTDRTFEEAKRDINAFLSGPTVNHRKDLFHLHFSGHGALDDNGNFYLCFRDTRLDNLVFSGIAYSDIEKWLEGFNVRRALITLDCCYSGAAFKRVRAGGPAGLSDRTLEADAAGACGWSVISAGGASELAREGDDLSFFTRHFIEGVRSGAADREGKGWVTSGDLHAYIRASLREHTGAQNPMIGGALDGPLVVALNPVAQALKGKQELEDLRRRAEDMLASRIADKTFTVQFVYEVTNWLSKANVDQIKSKEFDLISKFTNGLIYATEFLEAWQRRAPEISNVSHANGLNHGNGGIRVTPEGPPDSIGSNVLRTGASVVVTVSFYTLIWILANFSVFASPSPEMLYMVAAVTGSLSALIGRNFDIRFFGNQPASQGHTRAVQIPFWIAGAYGIHIGPIVASEFIGGFVYSELINNSEIYPGASAIFWNNSDNFGTGADYEGMYYLTLAYPVSIIGIASILVTRLLLNRRVINFD